MTREFDWENAKCVCTPSALLVYYLVLKSTDQKAKKASLVRKDEGNIAFYVQILGRSEVPNVSKTPYR